jgi:hypothetical protein
MIAIRIGTASIVQETNIFAPTPSTVTISRAGALVQVWTAPWCHNCPGNGGRGPVHPARHQRPRHPGHFVGKYHGHELVGLAQQQSPQLVRHLLAVQLHGGLDHRGRASHEQDAQSFIARPADPAQPLLPGSRGFLWQRRSGYSRRSLVETAIYRYMTIVDGRLHTRILPTNKPRQSPVATSSIE